MHKFLRAVGFSMYQKKPEIRKLLDEIVCNAQEICEMNTEDGTAICEIRGEVAPGMGIAVVGERNSEGVFHEEYYYPYLISSDLTSQADCSIQRHAEKETYAGLLDEYKVGISLIFYLQNMMEYRKRLEKGDSVKTESTILTALSVSGKILLPVQKTEKQKEKAKVASKDRNNLIEAAKNGDEDAMETLTIEDIDMYSQISRRMVNEDIYSIIDSFFMPCGVECDQYSMIGEILEIKQNENRITKEKVYDLTVECNDLVFHIGINQQDLLGEPLPGRRFKGKVWMQGTVKFES